jgi:hypothetical protein
VGANALPYACLQPGQIFGQLENSLDQQSGDATLIETMNFPMKQTTLSPERIEQDFLEALPVRRRIGSVAGILLVLFFTITTSRGKLIYDWDFTQSATDSVSNLTATFGNPAGRDAQGYTFTNVGEGVSVLQTGADSVSGTYTIEMVFSLDAAIEDDYQRLIDFSNFANDEGMYAYDNYFYFYDYD